MKHRETHETPVEGCYACKLLSLQISTSSAGAAEVTERERNWDRDMPAYRRLRKNGLQPKSIDGCAELETRATEKIEVEMGSLVPKERMSQVKEGLAVVKELQS